MKYKKITLGLMMFSFVGIGGWWYWQSTHHSHSDYLKVKTVEVKRGRITTTISGAGQVESAQETTIRANITGLIKDIMVKDGDRVKRHQELVKFDTDEVKNKLSQAKNNLSLAIIEVESSRQRLENTKELYQVNAVSKLQLDTDQKQYEKALVQHRQAEEELKFVKILLDKFSCLSPHEGTVISNKVEKGQTVHSGEPLLVITDTNRLQIRVEVDEIDIFNVKIGQKALVSINVLPDKELSGRVIRIAPSAQRRNNFTIVEVIVELTQTIPLLKIGMRVDVKIVTSDKKDILYIPLTALIREDNKKYVFIYQDGIVSMREIKTGIFNLESTEVLSGLNEGDEVIIPGTDKIKDKDKVSKK